MQESDFKDILATIPGLDAGYAIQAMGCSIELYRKLLSQIVRLTPSNVSQMDEYLRTNNPEGFRVKVHGVKGALRQACYTSLAKKAQDLENAAKAGDMDYCAQNYASFKDELIVFKQKAQEALNSIKREAVGQPSDFSRIKEHLTVLLGVRVALESFDCMMAMELLEPLSRKRFGGDADEIIATAMEQLELFSPEEALEQINKLFDSLG